MINVLGVKILFLLEILPRVLNVNILINSTGTIPYSVATKNNGLFIISDNSYYVTKVDGSSILKDDLPYIANPLFNSYHIAKSNDETSVISFNGFNVGLFDVEGLPVSNFENDDNNIDSTLVSYVSVFYYSLTQLILVKVINQNLFLSRVELPDGTSTEIAIFSQPILNHVSCFKRKDLSNGIVCSFILKNSDNDLMVWSLGNDLMETSSIGIPTISGYTTQMKSINETSFIICFLSTEANDLGCSFYDDIKQRLSKIILIPDKTGITEYYHFNMEVLRLKEIMIVYIQNTTPTSFKVQKIDFKGIIKGKSITITAKSNTVITNFNLLLFNIGKIGIVYGIKPAGVYYLELDVAACDNYCGNVDLSTETKIKMNIYSSSIVVMFTSRINTGLLKQYDQAVVPNVEYLSPIEFIYVSGGDITLVDAYYVAVNPEAPSSECMFNLFVGVKAKCKCTSVYYIFLDECIDKCPPYTFTDETIKECINCALSGQYLYERKCRPDIPSNTYISNIEYNVLTDCTPPCLTCTGIDNSCLSCPPYDTSCPLFCSNGYYRSITIGQCDKCYETCATCSGDGTADNHNCDTCLIDYNLFSPKQCYKTCNDINTSRWYIDNNKQFHCIPSTICPSVRPIYVKETNQCVESCSKLSSCIYCQLSPQALLNYTNTCVTECPINTVVNAKTYTCEEQSTIDIIITDKTIDEILKELNSTETKPGTVIIGEDYIIEIFDSIEKHGLLELSQINLSQCELILRTQYNIPKEEILIVIKIELERRNEVTGQIEYEIKDIRGNKLNLSYCNNIDIDITTQIKNTSALDLDKWKEYKDKGIDIYNPKDAFFTDICYPFTTGNTTDIILRDRMIDIFENASLCEEMCTYKEADLEKMTITCSCNIKPVIKTEINANFFAESFTSAFTESNFEVVTCYQIAFNGQILINSIGFWFYLSIMIIHLPLWCWLFIFGTSSIIKYCNEFPKDSPPQKTKVSFEVTNSFIADKAQIEKVNKSVDLAYSDLNCTNSHKNAPIQIGKPDIKESLFKMNSNRQRTENINIINPMITININNKNKNKNNTNTSLPRMKIIKDNSSVTKSFFNKQASFVSIATNNSNVNSNFILNPNEKSTFQLSRKTINAIPMSQRHKESDKSLKGKKSMFVSAVIPTITDTPQNTIGLFTEPTKQPEEILIPSMEILDDFTLYEARKFDTRNFFRLLYICLKIRHPILATFITKSHLSLRVIIIIEFIFGNVMDFAFNAFFYNDEMISKRYNYEGNLGFLFTLQNNFIIVLASFSLSLLITILLHCFSSSENKLEVLVKNKKEIKHFEGEMKRILRCYKIKLCIFLVLELLFMLFFWYYVVAFCAVYQNSQMSWFTGGLLSFGLSLLLPFPIALGIILVRQLAIKTNINWLYKFIHWCYRF